MYTEEQLSKLEQEELTITEEAIAVMILLLASTRNDIEKELRNFYQKYGKDGVITYHEARKWVSEKDHRRRSTVLLLTINELFRNTEAIVVEDFESFLTEVIGMEKDMFGADVDVEEVLAIKWGLDNLTWLERLHDNFDLWVARIQNDIKIGMIQQLNIEEVVERINARFGSITKAVHKLAVTESTAVGSLARKGLFKVMGVKKYRYFAKIDERTCEQCGALHGTIFPISEFKVGVTASPIHPHCRCWEEPIME